jgi:cell division initiation protein
MKLTPLDIKKQEFKKVMRGYDPVEVDTFMDMMSHEFEELLKEQKEMRDTFVETETQLKDYRQIEKTLQQMMLQAQEATGHAYEVARTESELILKEARMKASGILEQANAELSRVGNELVQLKSRKEFLLARLRVLLSSELELLKTLDLSNDPAIDASPSMGTGKESIELEEILKSIDDDRITKAD